MDTFEAIHSRASVRSLDQLGRIQGGIAAGSAAIALVLDEQASKYWKEEAGTAIENTASLAVLPIGKPAGAPQQARKKSLPELVYYETYGNRDRK